MGCWQLAITSERGRWPRDWLEDDIERTAREEWFIKGTGYQPFRSQNEKADMSCALQFRFSTKNELEQELNQ